MLLIEAHKIKLNEQEQRKKKSDELKFINQQKTQTDINNVHYLTYWGN